MAILGRNTQMLAIPGEHAFRIARLEENPADASDLFHKQFFILNDSRFSRLLQLTRSIRMRLRSLTPNSSSDALGKRSKRLVLMASLAASRWRVTSSSERTSRATGSVLKRNWLRAAESCNRLVFS